MEELLMTNAFYETRNLFRNYTGYTSPLTYEQWLSVADENKAAVLYVQFFEEITLAWYKTKSFYALEEDGVSTILQYLSKNVPVLKENPNRFTSAYIYKVAYNCLYCISHDIKRDRERWEFETSNIVETGEDVLDLFDTVVSNTEEDIDDRVSRSEFWKIIETMGPETEKVINHLLNGASLGKVKCPVDPSTKDKWANKQSKEKQDAMFVYMCMKNNYDLDPLKDVSVTADKAAAILDELREQLAKFRSVYHI